MIYDIKNEQPEKLENFKGGEKYLSAIIHDDGLNKILHGTLIPGGNDWRTPSRYQQ